LTIEKKEKSFVQAAAAADNPCLCEINQVAACQCRAVPCVPGEAATSSEFHYSGT
jgi:hypothetical protein